MGPKLKSSRRHTSELKHRWPRPPPLLERCVPSFLLSCVCVLVFVSVSSLELSPFWSVLFVAERYYRCVRGTTADKRQAVLAPTPAVLPPRGGRWAGYVGAGGVVSPPYPFAPTRLPRRSSDLSPQEGPGRPPFSCHPSPFPPVESIPTTSSSHGCRYCPRSRSLFA